MQAVKALVEIDKDWVPHSDGASLYIRPFVFATDVGMGVHASHNYTFCIICAPSGAYYTEGIDPVRIYVEDEYIRAAPVLPVLPSAAAITPRPLRLVRRSKSRASPRCCGWTAWRKSMWKRWAA